MASNKTEPSHPKDTENVTARSGRNGSSALLFIILGLNILLLLVNILRAFSGDTVENFKEWLKGEKSTLSTGLTSDVAKLDAKVKSTEKNLQKLSQLLVPPEVIKGKFDKEIASSIKLITTQITDMKKELDILKKEAGDLNVKLAELEEILRKKKK